MPSMLSHKRKLLWPSDTRKKAFLCNFAPSESKMAAKTTSSSGFDRKLFATGFLN